MDVVRVSTPFTIADGLPRRCCPRGIDADAVDPDRLDVVPGGRVHDPTGVDTWGAVVVLPRAARRPR